MWSTDARNLFNKRWRDEQGTLPVLPLVLSSSAEFILQLWPAAVIAPARESGGPRATGAARETESHDHLRVERRVGRKANTFVAPRA